MKAIIENINTNKDSKVTLIEVRSNKSLPVYKILETGEELQMRSSSTGVTSVNGIGNIYKVKLRCRCGKMAPHGDIFSFGQCISCEHNEHFF